MVHTVFSMWILFLKYDSSIRLVVYHCQCPLLSVIYFFFDLQRTRIGQVNSDFSGDAKFPNFEWYLLRFKFRKTWIMKHPLYVNCLFLWRMRFVTAVQRFMMIWCLNKWWNNHALCHKNLLHLNSFLWSRMDYFFQYSNVYVATAHLQRLLNDRSLLAKCIDYVSFPGETLEIGW